MLGGEIRLQDIPDIVGAVANALRSGRHPGDGGRLDPLEQSVIDALEHVLRANRLGEVAHQVQTGRLFELLHGSVHEFDRVLAAAGSVKIDDVQAVALREFQKRAHVEAIGRDGIPARAEFIGKKLVWAAKPAKGLCTEHLRQKPTTYGSVNHGADCRALEGRSAGRGQRCAAQRDCPPLHARRAVKRQGVRRAAGPRRATPRRRLRFFALRVFSRGGRELILAQVPGIRHCAEEARTAGGELTALFA
mmetsp:Transcript_121995/g.350522  ORF Transcript_121995/g.350522 Transcript_121995/m.350522 type:complete len:248 (-) Transcript_121995:23-766(-)